MRLLLVRHGDPDYIHDSLTADGQREAGLLSVRFAGEHVDECFVSPMGRAKATAVPVIRTNPSHGKRRHRFLKFKSIKEPTSKTTSPSNATANHTGWPLAKSK